MERAERRMESEPTEDSLRVEHEKIGVLEEDEHSEVRDKAGHEQQLSACRIFNDGQASPNVIVQRRREENQPAAEHVPAHVKDIACDQEKTFFRAEAGQQRESEEH